MGPGHRTFHFHRLLLGVSQIYYCLLQRDLPCQHQRSVLDIFHYDGIHVCGRPCQQHPGEQIQRWPHRDARWLPLGHWPDRSFLLQHSPATLLLYLCLWRFRACLQPESLIDHNWQVFLQKATSGQWTGHDRLSCVSLYPAPSSVRLSLISLVGKEAFSFLGVSS